MIISTMKSLCGVEWEVRFSAIIWGGQERGNTTHNVKSRLTYQYPDATKSFLKTSVTNRIHLIATSKSIEHFAREIVASS